MPPAPCNKCKAGRQTESDSWCLGCAALETAQSFLRKRWLVSGTRAVAEETLLSAARVVRALHNLDNTLPSTSGSGPRFELTPKSKAERPRSRSPREDNRPPLVRRAPSQEAPARPPARKPEESEDEYTEESAEEEVEVRDREVEPERSDVKKEERADSVKRRSERPPEPPEPPKGYSGHKKKAKKKKNKSSRGRRGGTRHQKHYRERDNPFRSSHRRLSGGILEFAGDLDSGLERRY